MKEVWFFSVAVLNVKPRTSSSPLGPRSVSSWLYSALLIELPLNWVWNCLAVASSWALSSVSLAVSRFIPPALLLSVMVCVSGPLSHSR